MKHELLNYLEHRTAPLPKGPWAMYQRWDDILCLHIPVDAEALSRYIPDGLSLDLYEGSAWVSIFPFKIKDLQFRGLPKPPYIHHFLELNVRTYVKHKNIPGIYFFSLDAEKSLPVLGARMGTLPYFKAKMRAKEKDGWIHYESRRQYSSEVYFKGKYRPAGPTENKEYEPLEKWLLERYYLFNTVKGTVIHVGIHHLPWRPEKADIVYDKQSLKTLMPGSITGEPVLAHYVNTLEVIFWLPQKS